MARIPNIKGFVEDMKAKDIHVGMGVKPYCVTCDEPWPCRISLIKEAEK